MPKATTPAPIVLDDVLEVVLKGTVAAGGSNQTPCGNVFYYRRSLIAAGINKTSFKTIFASTVIAPLLAATHQDYSPNSVVIRNIQDATDPAIEIAVAGAGAIATDREPSEDSIVMRLKTSFRGKPFRGFKMFGGSNEVDTIQDILTGAGLGRWQAVRDVLDDVLTDADGNMWTPFIFSRYKSDLSKNPVTVRGTDIQSCTLNKRVSRMTKRRAASVI